MMMVVMRLLCERECSDEADADDCDERCDVMLGSFDRFRAFWLV